MAARSLKIAITGAVFATTVLIAPAHAQEYVPPAAPPIRETIDENGVDLTRGALVSRSHSVSIGGPGRMGLSWSRTITSDRAFRDSTAIYLDAPFGSNTITVTIGAGSESFTKSGANYISNERTGATLSLSGSTYTFTSRDGVVYTLEPWQGADEQYGGTHRATLITYPTGERLTFNYEIDDWCILKPGSPDCESQGTAERLASVAATNGYMLAFGFAASEIGGPATMAPWMTITKVTTRNMSVDPLSQSWPTLTLDGVETFTDSLDRTTTYTYSSGRMAAIKRPGASSNSTIIAYTSGKVSSVINNGVTTNYTYADASGVRTTTIIDAIEGDRVVKTDLSTMLVTSDANELLIPQVTTYEYHTDSGLLKKVTAPEGNAAEFVYDARGNLTKTTATPKPGSPLAAIVIEATYPPSDGAQPWKCASPTTAAACNKPLTTTDARGNVTDYEWYSGTGDVRTVTLPPPSTGAVRPQTRYDYTSRYAQYLSGETLVNFATPVTRLSGVSACQTTAASGLNCAGGAADEVKSAISYGGSPNALPMSVVSGSGTGTPTATTASPTTRSATG